MRLALVKPVGPVTMIDIVGPDLGLGLITAAARRAGWETALVDCHLRGLDQEALLRELIAFAPDVVGFKAFTKDIPSVCASVREIRCRLPGTLVIAGGPLPSALGLDAARWLEGVDLLVRGEADRALPQLLAELEGRRIEGGWDLDPGGLESVPGLIHRDADGAWVAHPQDLPDDLDSVGLPDWDAYDFAALPEWSTRSPHPYVPVQTSRGCPYDCQFCSVCRISGKRTRRKSVDAVIAEVRHYVESYGVRHFSIVDDDFLGDRDHAVALCDRLRRERLVDSWDCSSNGIRLNQLDAGLVRALDRAGCAAAALGIEAGTDRVLREIHKASTTAQIDHYVRMLRDHSDIRLHGFFILGFPGETVPEMLQTVEFAANLPIHTANFFSFTPHPGTPIFDRMVAEGLVDGTANPADFVYERPTLNNGGLDGAGMRALMAWAHLRFFGHPGRWRHDVELVNSRRKLRKTLSNLGHLSYSSEVVARVRQRLPWNHNSPRR